METGIETGTETGICDRCGEYHNIDMLMDVNDGRYTYCDNCMSEFCSQCDHCGDYYLRDDIYMVADGDYKYCQHCVDDVTFSCHNCGGLYNNSDNNYMYLTIDRYGNNAIYCESCCDEVATHCAVCGNEFDASLMDQCCEPDEQNIHDDCYSPIWCYHKIPANDNANAEGFFAMELESEIDDSYDYDDVAGQVTDENFTFCKRDGSIRRGFEMVTHPMSWNYLTKNFDRIEEKLNYIANNGGNSHNTETCGIHIHFTRSLLSEAQLYNFLKFCYANLALLQVVSQRKRSTSGCQWSCDNEPFRNNYMDRCQKTFDCTKYTAINLAHPGTIEVRIFRGNLRPDRVRKNFQFVKSVIDFAKTALTEDLTLDNYYAHIDAYNDSYPDLIDFLNFANRSLINNFSI